MKYLNLDDVKKHLNVDEEYDEDDLYIASLCDVAELVVEKDLDETLSDIEDEDGDVPAPVRHAMLLLIGSLYANREPVSYSSAIEVPLSYQYLLSLYHNYKYKQ